MTALEPYKSLTHMLRDRAMRFPARRVFTFLGAGGEEQDHLSYGALDARARAVAATLQSFGARGERVLLLYPPGLDFIVAFFGCLYAGAIAVPLPSVTRRERSLRGLHAITTDASPALALTTSEGLGFVKRALTDLVGTHRLRWLTTDLIAPELQDEWWDPGVRDQDIAYLQYTSGSTSLPKGVVLRHSDVLENSVQIGAALAYDADSVAVMWLPHFHDNGLVHGVVQPVFNPFHSVMMAPQAFIQRPFRWLEAISRYRATHSGGPNFAYGLCVRRVSAAERAQLDLRSWRVAYNAAEPVRKHTLEEFAAAFAASGFRSQSFYPAYGLAEATLLVTIKSPASEVSHRTIRNGAVGDNVTRNNDNGGGHASVVVGCGPSVPNTRVVIVSPRSLTPCPPGTEGEVWISGPSVAAGYWNRPDETALTFNAFLAESGEGPFLRTGDLGFLHDGELFVTGRIKDLIIVRGQNHYPQDIETTVELAHPAIRQRACVAFSVEVDDTEGLVVIAELESPRAGAPLDATSVREAVREAVADAHGLYLHGLVLAPPGTIPKTSSGKLQRHACKANFLAGRIDSLEVERARSGA